MKLIGLIFCLSGLTSISLKATTPTEYQNLTGKWKGYCVHSSGSTTPSSVILHHPVHNDLSIQSNNIPLIRKVNTWFTLKNEQTRGLVLEGSATLGKWKDSSLIVNFIKYDLSPEATGSEVLSAIFTKTGKHSLEIKYTHIQSGMERGNIFNETKKATCQYHNSDRSTPRN